MTELIGGGGYSQGLSNQQGPRSEEIIVDLMREDLGVSINAQAFRMFIRQRWDKIHGPAHRIHEGKR